MRPKALRSSAAATPKPPQPCLKPRQESITFPKEVAQCYNILQQEPWLAYRQSKEEKAMVKVAINGFGRIGRIALRVWLQRADLQEKLNLVAINTSGSMTVSGWAHLVKYDTAYGPLREEIAVQEVRKPEATTD